MPDENLIPLVITYEPEAFSNLMWFICDHGSFVRHRPYNCVHADLDPESVDDLRGLEGVSTVDRRVEER